MSTAAHRAIGRAAIGLAAISLAVTGLTACGGSADRAEGPSATPAASSASIKGPAPAAPPKAGSGGGAYCDVFRDQGAKLLLLRKTTGEADPAKVKSNFDSVVAVYEALADAAPPELRAAAEVQLKTFKDDREEIARAGWKSRAVLEVLAGDLRDDAYVDAVGRHMTYLQEVCHVDPANPAGIATG
jgi:hypothetical protein